MGKIKSFFKIKNRWPYLLLGLLIFVIGTVIIDLIRISEYKLYPKKPSEKINLQQDQIYYDLIHEVDDLDWSRLDGTLKYITKEYDCSDFRLVNLVRILYDFESQIPEETLSEIHNTIFGFRYWWDYPGENSMCYWSENHQILFASAEYLIGQRYPDTVFQSDGHTGREHMALAKKRALDWLEMRWKYGFTEFFSGVYYKEDIGAMINLIDYAEDEELVKKTRIIMDLLFYDVATQNVNTMFVSTSGRAYTGNRKGGSEATLGGLTNYYWGDGKEINPGMMYGMIVTEKYSLPPVLIDIAKDTNSVVVKQSSGLDLSELKTEGYYGEDNKSMMMQLGMEAFTNPEIIRNTISFIRSHNMFSNEFISDFKFMDFSLIKWLRLESLIARIINPQTNGVAIQKGNTYTYKTKEYSLYSAQKYHPGTYGDQQHVAGMNIKNYFSIFHTHPALEEGIPHSSPNYWVGYGYLPHVAQDRNVSLAIYDIPNKKGLMEMDLLDYTHAYFPAMEFDSVILKRNYAMGKKGTTYSALISYNPLQYKENTSDNLIQKGKQTFWIIEAGSQSDDQTFSAFCERILNNKIEFDPEILELTYESQDRKYNLNFGGDFLLDNEKMNMEYIRYNSPYSQTAVKPDSIRIEYNDKYLFLDFYNLTRDF